MSPSAQRIASNSRVYVLILNWNNCLDTIECLESVLRSRHPDYRVIVCDNGSTDGSLERIAAWAEGRSTHGVAVKSSLGHLSTPPVAKPVTYVTYERAEAERGAEAAGDQAKLVLIRVGSNLGFGAGNNVGLRFALARGDFDYVWLLNNDTVVEPDTLGELLARMRQVPSAGICGPTFLYYHEPQRVHAWGGATFSTWIAAGRHLGERRSKSEGVDPDRVESRMKYVVGASMLVSREFLRDIGLLSEEYFLYFEEIDWATRARGRYRLAFAPRAIVYHKEGATAGTGAEARSLRAEYYLKRNRLRFTAKHFPFALPTVYLNLILLLVRRGLRGEWGRVKVIAGILIGKKWCGDQS